MTVDNLKECVEMYGNDILAYCLHLTRNRSDAEELYQEVWLSVYKNINKICADKNVKAYILTVATNKWNNQRRKMAWRNRIIPKAEYDEASILNFESVEDGLTFYMQEEQNKYVREVVNKLTDKCRGPVSI